MARKRTPPTVLPSAPGSARLEAAIREQQQRIAAAMAALGSAGEDDVHGARVAARRLRSMLKTFGPLLDEPRVQRYRAHLRTFARALGTAREADVRRALLLDLAADAHVTAAERRRLNLLLDDACLASRSNSSVTWPSRTGPRCAGPCSGTHRVASCTQCTTPISVSWCASPRARGGDR